MLNSYLHLVFRVCHGIAQLRILSFSSHSCAGMTPSSHLCHLFNLLYCKTAIYAIDHEVA